MTKRIQASALAVLLAAGAAGARFTDRDGLPLRRVPARTETAPRPVPLADISPQLIIATLAAEDRRFFRHSGVDWRAVLRAAAQNLSARRTVSGASTITMQLATLDRPGGRSLGAKIWQAARAASIERASSKDDILSRYLNRLDYGNLTRGADSASRLYFGKPASSLSLAESAFLAGLPQSPTRYDPYRRFRPARERQLRILDRLYRWGWISKEAYFLALKERPGIVPREKVFRAPHFTRRVFERTSRLPGLRSPVRTTIDLALQDDVEAILRSHVGKLASHRVTGGAVVVLDNPTGDVLAWAGSPDFFDEDNAGQVDGAASPRQPGSALKPFLYGLGMSRDMSPATVLADVRTFEDDGFSPRNYDKTYHGPVRLRRALACSYNVPAVRAAKRLGPGDFLSLLRDAGFASLDKDASHYGTGLALGNGEVTLLELVNAYAGLARGGIWVPERYLLGAERTGETPRRFMSPEAAYLVTHMLSDNDARVPAFGPDSPFHVPFPMAAKTGTTKDYRDNWAVAFTRDWTVGVWVGNPDNSPMRRVSGITGAAPILRDVALTLWDRREPSPFERPKGVVEADICPLSGKTPGLWCPTRMTEVFVKGKTPGESCGMHRHDGKKVVVVLPEEYRAWEDKRAPEAGEPALSSCAGGNAAGKAYISFPNNGDVFKIDPSFPRRAQKIKVRAVLPGGTGAVRWTVDGNPPADAARDHFWLALSPGRHRIGLTLETGGAPIKAPPVSIYVAR